MRGPILTSRVCAEPRISLERMHGDVGKPMHTAIVQVQLHDADAAAGGGAVRRSVTR